MKKKKFKKINYDVMIITSPKTSQTFPSFGPPQSQFLATPVSTKVYKHPMFIQLVVRKIIELNVISDNI